MFVLEIKREVPTPETNSTEGNNKQASITTQYFWLFNI